MSSAPITDHEAGALLHLMGYRPYEYEQGRLSEEFWTNGEMVLRQEQIFGFVPVEMLRVLLRYYDNRPASPAGFRDGGMAGD